MTPDTRTLFDGPPASPADPPSSHAAGDRHTASGARGRNCAAVLALVRRHSGCTSVELHGLLLGDPPLSREEVSRRLSDLRNAGRVRQGDQVVCSRRGTKMVSWYAVEGQG